MLRVATGGTLDELPSVPRGHERRGALRALDLDLDVDARWQVKALQ
jgi:hypothetical protein